MAWLPFDMTMHFTECESPVVSPTLSVKVLGEPVLWPTCSIFSRPLEPVLHVVSISRPKLKSTIPAQVLVNADPVVEAIEVVVALFGVWSHVEDRSEINAAFPSIQ